MDNFDSLIYSDISINSNIFGGAYKVVSDDSNNYINKNIFNILLLCIVIIVLYFVFSNLNINHFTSEPNIISNNSKYKQEKNINLIDSDNKNMFNSLVNKIKDLDLSNSNNNQENNKVDQLTKHINDLKDEINSIKSTISKQESDNTIDINIKTNQNQSNKQTQLVNDNRPIEIYDPIANYDRAKLFDPLVDPRGRTSADEIPTPQVAAQLNFPTQGILDRYHRIGLLIELDNIKSDYDEPNFYTNNPVSLYNKKTGKSNNFNQDNISNRSNDYRGVEIVQHNTPYIDNEQEHKNNRKNKKLNISNKLVNKMTKLNKSKLGTNKYEKFDNYSDDSDSESDYKSESDYQSESFDNYSNNSDYKKYKYKNKNIFNNYVQSSDDNSILELIGQKITQNWYKYFTSISKGNKIIKIVVHNRNRRELYDGDIVFIPELDKSYRVKLDKMDMIQYNPYFF